MHGENVPHRIELSAHPISLDALSRQSRNEEKRNGSSALFNLFTPLKKVLSNSSTESSSPTVQTWSSAGYENLPASTQFKLIEMKQRRSSSGDSFSSASSADSHRPTRRHSLGRFIPANVGFTLEFSGPVPLEIRSFEVKELSPALLQAGKYIVNLSWFSAHSASFTKMAAAKDITIKYKRRTLAHITEDESEIAFEKGFGPASFHIQKEGWLYRERDASRRLMWHLTFDPHTPRSYFDSGSESESRCSSRSDSVHSKSGLSRSVSFDTLPRKEKASARFERPKLARIRYSEAILSTSPEDYVPVPTSSPSTPARRHG